MLRPNIMWLWSAIALVIIGYWIFSNDDAAPVKSDWATVEQLVVEGDVERISVINREEARVVLKSSEIDSLRGKKKFVHDEKNYTLSDGKTTFKLGQQVRIKVVGVNFGERKAEFVIENA